MDPLRPVKPAVRALRAYTLPPRAAPIKVNQNENPYDVPDALKAEVLARLAARPWSRYPDFVPSSLHEHLARHAGWRPDGVLAGNGSNELIQVALTVLVGPGARVVVPEPTFLLYRQMTTVLGGTVVPVPLRDDLSFDGPGLVEAASRERVVAVVVCSPNNPTGGVLGEGDLRALLAAARGWVIVDEAYHEFSGRTVVPLLEEFRNLLVLRTFSKAMGMAGLRIGYALGHPEVVGELVKARLPYNVNVFSSIAAEVACEGYDRWLEPAVERIVADREVLRRAIAEIPGFVPHPSESNFLLVRSAWTPADVLDGLFTRGILARDVSGYPKLAGCFRLNVGTPDENHAIVQALAAFAAERGEEGRAP